jgi:hypothetical protein
MVTQVSEPKLRTVSVKSVVALQRVTSAQEDWRSQGKRPEVGQQTVIGDLSSKQLSVGSANGRER